MDKPVDWDCMYKYKDLKEQLGGAIETLEKLRGRVADLKINLVHHVDQGHGLTQDQLVVFYSEINNLFPTKIRKCRKVDTRLDEEL
jgi:CRISPR/Cas system CSM-associated protein Csm2 small subunit